MFCMLPIERAQWGKRNIFSPNLKDVRFQVGYVFHEELDLDAIS